MKDFRFRLLFKGAFRVGLEEKNRQLDIMAYISSDRRFCIIHLGNIWIFLDKYFIKIILIEVKILIILKFVCLNTSRGQLLNFVVTNLFLKRHTDKTSLHFNVGSERPS